MRMPLPLVLLTLSLLLPAGNLLAAQADHVTANDAWIRLLPAKLPAGGYVTLHNTGSSVATLIAAHSAAYASVMLHHSSVGSGGMSSMSAVGQLPIPPQGTVTLAPAGYHLMLEQVTRVLKPGDNVDITLDFADGSHLPVHFQVRPANAADPQ
jgi:periplasmic copper chaperone A